VRARPDAPPALSEVLSFLSAAFQKSTPTPEDAIAGACAAHISGNDRLTPADQVEIYRQQFWFRHYDSLVEDYPGTHYIVGDDIFAAFCRAYLDASPPRTPTLRDLGAGIVAFAQEYTGFPADRRALALDMIRYEHAFIDVFDGPAYAPLDAAKLAALPPDALETARIVFHPLLVPLRLDYPVQHLRYAIKMGETPELPTAPSSWRVVLFREESVIRYDELTEPAFALLLALQSGVPLVPACGEVASGLGDAGAEALAKDVGVWFEQWAARGFIVDIAT